MFEDKLKSVLEMQAQGSGLKRKGTKIDKDQKE